MGEEIPGRRYRDSSRRRNVPAQPAPPTQKPPAKVGANALLNPLVVLRDGSTTPRAPNMCLALISSQGTIDSM